MEPVKLGMLPRKVARVLVYDFETGELQHIHQHVTFDGGHEPDHEQLEKRALENAMVRQGRDASRMRFLHLYDDNALRPGSRYKVDVRNVALVETGTMPPPGQIRRAR
jgi:hypothetical protein